MPRCETCGRFHSGGPGSAWKMVYGGAPIPTPYEERTRCRACVARIGPFVPQHGIKPEYSCGIVVEIIDPQ